MKISFPYLLAPIRVLATLFLAVCYCGRGMALNIVITNDDGFEASTIHALYQVLKTHGHSVIIASETQDNSGKGGALDFFVPIGVLTQPTRAGTIMAGAPGVGSSPVDADVHYVNATPVAAALYGIDILAREKWGALPDLVISGPNYGNNTGAINNQSGTVNAALIAINRGIPAIAVSTANPAKFKSFELLQESDSEFEDAYLVDVLVESLAAARARNKAVLPRGLGLNVNIPDFSTGAGKKLILRWSYEGSATHFMPVFVANLSTDAKALQFGVKAPPLPGISVTELPYASPEQTSFTNRAIQSEEFILRAGSVSVSVLHGNHEATTAESQKVRRLFAPTVVRP